MRFVWLTNVKPHWAEKSVGALSAGWKALSGSSPDILHLHSVVAGSMAPILKWKLAPCVLQMHGIEWLRSRWGPLAKGVLRSMERVSLSSASALTAVSRTQCEYFKKEYGLDCDYIPTAADIKDFASPRLICDLGIKPKGYIFFAARLVPEKGVHHLIRAFRRLPTEKTLIIAGEAPDQGGYGNELRRLAGDDARIRFVGRVQGALLEELYSNAALFAQPSELEGLSIGLLEGMSYGLPCLASDIPENREVVGNTGVLFRSKDVDDLEKKLAWSLDNTGALTKLAASGRRRVREQFNWETVVDQLEALYSRTAYGTQRHGYEKVAQQPAA